MGALTTELILVVLLLRSVGAAFHTPCLQAGHAPDRAAGPADQVFRLLPGPGVRIPDFKPGGGGCALQLWSLSGIVFLDVIGALIAVFTLGIAVIPELQRDENSGGVRVLQEAMEGFRILQTNKGMLGLVLIGSLYTLGADAHQRPVSPDEHVLFQRHQHKRQHRGGGIFRWPAVWFPGAVEMGRDEKQGLHHCWFIPSYELQLIYLRHAAARRLLAVRRLFLAHGRVRSILLGNVHVSFRATSRTATWAGCCPSPPASGCSAAPWVWWSRGRLRSGMGLRNGFSSQARWCWRRRFYVLGYRRCGSAMEECICVCVGKRKR